MTFDITPYKSDMNGTIDAYKKELEGLRTGRAHPGLLESVVVDAYGARTPLSQLSSVTAPEARLLSIQVWDGGLVNAVQKAITEANLGLNPMAEGQVVRVTLPELTEERRRELVKVANKYAEQARIGIRNHRRKAIDNLKALEKDKDISEDDQRRYTDDVQKVVDDYIKNVDDLTKSKEQDIMHV
jgi:ribosome recycling factor